MARFYVQLSCLFVICGVHGMLLVPVTDETDEINLNFLGSEIYGKPSHRTGELVAKWTPDMGNPEELGEYFEGDILHPQPMAKSGMANTLYRWPNKTVPFEIGNEFSDDKISLIISAINDFHLQTCIKFVPRTTEDDYLIISGNSTGCWSSIGRIGGAQTLNLQIPGCVTLKGTAIHEFMHALGFIHEHSRPDRDDYITILYENVLRGASNINFMKYPVNLISYFNKTYDYNSVMHYNRKAFSSNGNNTIVPKDPSYTGHLGQRVGLSTKDVQIVNKMYNCEDL